MKIYHDLVLKYKGLDYLIKLNYEFSEDHSYGSDADGNRGIYHAECEDEVFTIHIHNKDITENLIKTNPELYSHIAHKVAEFMSTDAYAVADCYKNDIKKIEFQNSMKLKETLWKRNF